MTSKTSLGRRMLVLKIMLLPTCANSLAQLVTLDETDQSIPVILKKIEDQTRCNFFSETHIFDNAPPVTVSLSNATVDLALNKCFSGLEFGYSKDGVVYTLYRKVAAGVSLFSPFTGTVKSVDGSSIARASITIPGAKRGVMTNTDGSFSLPSTEHTISVEITCSGYTKRIVQLDNREPNNITLQTNAVPIDEFILWAYGTTTDRLNTGSSSHIKASTLEQQPIMNPLGALSCRAPGLEINQLNGNPGSGFNVQIRGQSSIDNARPPLTIVDGVILSDGIISTIPSGSPKGQTGANILNSIPPAIIDNIEVLKDAASTSIYGSKGANGVLLITTKRGSPGKMQLTASTYAGFEQAVRSGQMMNTTQYLSMRRSAVANDGLIPDAGTIPEYAWDTTISRNFKNIIMGGSGIVNDNSIVLSGGAASHLLFLNANYHRQSSIVPGDQFDKRISSFCNYGHESVDKKFHLQLSANYCYEANHLPVLDLSNYILLAPLTPYPATTGNSYSWSQDNISFANLKALQLDVYKSSNNSWLLHSEVSYQVLPKFSVRTFYGQHNGTLEEQSWMPAAGQDPQLHPSGYYYWARNQYSSKMGQATTDYSLSVGKYGNLDLLAGVMRQEEIKEYMSFTVQNYENNSTAIPKTQAEFNRIIYRYEAFMGRLEYNLLDKYIITVSGRNDASSRFGPDKRDAWFGAVGAAWIFTADTAINWPHWLSFGKLRTSYGTTGNDQIGDYKFASLYSTTSAATPYQGLQGLTPNSFYNPSLSWEVNHKTELGLELGILNNRFDLSMSFYRNWTGNELVQESLASQAGLPGQPINQRVVILNKGLECNLRTVNYSTLSFHWSSTFSFTLPQNTLTSFPGLKSSTYAGIYTEGRSLTEQIVLGYLGVDPQTGLYSYFDKDHNDTIDSRDNISGGNLDLRFYGGLDNNFSYKDWEWGFFLEFRQRNGISPLVTMLTQNLPGMPGNYSQGNFPVQFLNYWKKPGDRVAFQRVTSDITSRATGLAGNLPLSSARVVDASFIRLKNMWVNRKISRNLLRKYHMKDGFVFIRAENILTLTHFPFTDPETQNFNMLPPVRTFILGLQITL